MDTLTHTQQVRKDIRKTLSYKAQISAKESKRRGKTLRSAVSHESHAQWDVRQDRAEAVALIFEQDSRRVQELVPIRHERMAASPFAFFRGAAAIMAYDLAKTSSTGIEVQACGDAHISNFGLFHSPERTLVFDITDFDETAIAPWEWDVKRLAASLEICGKERGFSSKKRRRIVKTAVEAYRVAMREFAAMGTMDVWYAHMDAEELYERMTHKASKSERKETEEIFDKARTKNSARAITKLTETVDGELRIVSEPPLIVPLREFAREGGVGMDAKQCERVIARFLSRYRKSLPHERRLLVEQYRGVDVARKVVGVGSVGLQAWIVVLEGAAEGDHLVLQIKEAQASVLERFVGHSESQCCGERVVKGQKAMQTAGDVLLGWFDIGGKGKEKRSYYVRQLWDGKGSADLEDIDDDALEALAAACGWTLAHAHARTGDRFAIAGYLGKSDAFDRAIADFARCYARQNELDYQAFLNAVKR